MLSEDADDLGCSGESYTEYISSLISILIWVSSWLRHGAKSLVLYDLVQRRIKGRLEQWRRKVRLLVTAVISEKGGGLCGASGRREEEGNAVLP